MTGIVEFLTARLDEDEAVALAAITPVGDRWVMDNDRADCAQIEVASDSDYQIVVYDEGVPTPEQARHIIRHDPARVLRDVEAKRIHLADYEQAEREWTRHQAAVREYQADVERADRGEPVVGNLGVQAQALNREADYLLVVRAALERVLRADALPFAGHPDYDPSWRP